MRMHAHYQHVFTPPKDLPRTDQVYTVESSPEWVQTLVNRLADTYNVSPEKADFDYRHLWVFARSTTAYAPFCVIAFLRDNTTEIIAGTSTRRHAGSVTVVTLDEDCKERIQIIGDALVIQGDGPPPLEDIPE